MLCGCIRHTYLEQAFDQQNMFKFPSIRVEPNSMLTIKTAE